MFGQNECFLKLFDNLEATVQTLVVYVATCKIAVIEFMGINYNFPLNLVKSRHISNQFKFKLGNVAFLVLQKRLSFWLIV